MFDRLSMAVAALTARSNRTRRTPSVWIFSDVQRLPDPSTVVTGMRTACGLVIRHPDSAQRAQLVHKTLASRRSLRVKIVVSQDWRLAASLRADGVHIPESDVMRMPVGLRLWRRSGRRLITTSAHSGRGVRRARHLRPDMIFVSPIFPSLSHPGRMALGTMWLARICRKSSSAIGALGGVTHHTLRALQHTQISAVAGISFALKTN
jgi:thiamine-phosphate pyrophosphorylase